MWGADDPDCRKPMIWDEFEYDDEIAHLCDYSDDCTHTRQADKIDVDHDLLNFYKQIIKLRKEFPVLNRGTYKTLFTDDTSGIFAFERSLDNQQIVAIFNSHNTVQNISKKALPGCDKKWKLIAGDINKKRLAPKSFAIFFKE